MPTARLSDRFDGWSELRPGALGGAPDSLRPFFAGVEAYDRMDAMRQAINEIRTQWHRYPEFMGELERTVRTIDGGAAAAAWAQLLASTKSWEDGASHPDRRDYTAVSLYTSDSGYRQIYQVINNALRAVEFQAGDPLPRVAAFLMELINIDLFNYLARNTAASGFQGTVYRGMCVTAQELESFREVAAGPVARRYLSIPLSIASASSDLFSALRFAMERAERDASAHPLVWEIDVHGLPDEDLAAYRAKYPRSIVTSLCAVPIERLSAFPQEREVLLRGPHFEIVGFHEASEVPGFDRPACRVEVVMLNSNRDHSSAVASNAGADRAARDLFRAMVVAHRSAVCAEHARRAGREDDAGHYGATAEKNRRLATELLAGGAAS